MTDASSSASSVTHPIDPAKFDKKYLRFDPCVMSTFGENKTPYGRAKFHYANPDLGGALQPVVIKGPPMHSFGVSDNMNDRQEVTGHSVCLTLPKDDNHPFNRSVLSLYEACCEYLAANAEQCGLNPDNVNSAAAAKILMKCPAEYGKNKEKKVDKSKGRRLYAKILEYAATENRPAKMATIFDDGTSLDLSTRKMTRQLNPLDVRSSCELIPSILFDSIYFGSKPSIQVKLPRAVVTRELVSNAVAPLDEETASYMISLGLGSAEAASASSAVSDPAALL